MNDNTFQLNPDAVIRNLKTILLGKDIHFFDEVTSTFDVAQLLDVKDGSIICARVQTNGRGRLGRSWESARGGIYFSLILQNRFTSEKLQLMTAACALGVQKGLSGYIDCKIKWPNDIISENGMKLCGILTKLKSADGFEEYINVGIGINANTDSFDAELKYAASIRSLTGHVVDENKILCSVLSGIEQCLALSEADLMDEYSLQCITPGSRVRVIYADGSGELTGLCTGIKADGALEIQKDDGSFISVNSGEVSVRGVYGENYV